MIVVTANFGENKVLVQDLAKSCVRNGIECRVYGEGIKMGSWKDAKVKRLRELLETLTEDIVMFSDGWDSLILRNAKAIERAFNSFKTDVVIAGNRTYYPQRTYKKAFLEDGETSFAFPCAGQFIGKRTKLIRVLRAMERLPDNDDQALWQRIIIGNKFNIKIDQQCKIFITMLLVDPSEFVLGKRGWRVLETNKYPCAVHFGGPKGNSPNGVNMNNFYKIIEGKQ